MQILSYTIYGIKNKKQIPSLVSKEKVPQSPLIVIVLLSSIKKKTVSKLLQQQRLLDSFISFSWS